MKKIICSTLTIIMLCLALAGCGSSKSVDVDGYYCFESNQSQLKLYLEIDGSDAVFYSNNFNDYGYGTFEKFSGNVESADDGKDIYFQDQMSKYVPLHVKLSENGESLYVSSDNDAWGGTLTFEKTDKKEWKEIVDDLSFGENGVATECNGAATETAPDDGLGVSYNEDDE